MLDERLLILGAVWLGASLLGTAFAVIFPKQARRPGDKFQWEYLRSALYGWLITLITGGIAIPSIDPALHPLLLAWTAFTQAAVLRYAAQDAISGRAHREQP